MSAPTTTIRKASARRIVGAQSKSSVQNRISKSSSQKRTEVLRSKSKSITSKGAKVQSLMKSEPATRIAPTAVINRESWLSAAIELLRPEFSAQGSPLPSVVRASIGWTRSRRALAECWTPSSSTDNATEIFVIPTNNMDDPMVIFGILCHELCHAALPAGTSHKRPFVDLGHRMLLEGQPKTLNAGEAFKEKWAKPLATLGPFPAQAMVSLVNAFTGGAKKEKKRKHKMVCTECSMTFRLAEKWITPGLQCPDRDCIGLMESR